MSSAGVVGLFDSLTGGEVFLVLILALVILGPERLPEMARTIGQWMATLRRMTADLQGEMREVMDDPAMQSIREVGEFVAQPRKKLSEMVAAADAFNETETDTDPASASGPDSDPEVETADVGSEAEVAADTDTGAETDTDTETEASVEAEPAAPRDETSGPDATDEDAGETPEHSST
jgi:sec-independent protein translocase protein TatB